MRWSRGLVVGLAGSSLAMAVVACGLLFAERLGRASAGFFVGVGGVGAATVALGVIVTWRVGANAVGPLLALIGFSLVFLAARDVYEHAWLADPGGVPLSAE